MVGFRRPEFHLWWLPELPSEGLEQELEPELVSLSEVGFRTMPCLLWLEQQVEWGWLLGLVGLGR